MDDFAKCVYVCMCMATLEENHLKVTELLARQKRLIRVTITQSLPAQTVSQQPNDLSANS